MAPTSAFDVTHRFKGTRKRALRRPLEHRTCSSDQRCQTADNTVSTRSESVGRAVQRASVAEM